MNSSFTAVLRFIVAVLTQTFDNTSMNIYIVNGKKTYITQVFTIDNVILYCDIQ